MFGETMTDSQVNLRGKTERCVRFKVVKVTDRAWRVICLCAEACAKKKRVNAAWKLRQLIT